MSLFHRKSRGMAIRDKCLDCVGGELSEVRKCTAHACPLFRFRLGSESRSLKHVEPRSEVPSHLPVIGADGKVVKAAERGEEEE